MPNRPEEPKRDRTEGLGASVLGTEIVEEPLTEKRRSMDLACTTGTLFIAVLRWQRYPL